MRRMIERQAEMEAAQKERDELIEARGHALQVTPQPDASPLFLFRDDERRRIHWQDGNRRWGLRGSGQGGSRGA